MLCKVCQKCYSTIPKLLYRKDYVQNLLDIGWIKKSISAYSSPTKKASSQHFSANFHKTIPEWHPVPEIQNLIDRIAGNS